MWLLLKKEILEKRIAKLEKKLTKIKEEERQNQPWKPEYNVPYHYIRIPEGITKTINVNSESDRKRISQGNCFRTKQEAVDKANHSSYNEILNY